MKLGECAIYITLIRINLERENQFEVLAWLFSHVFLKNAKMHKKEEDQKDKDFMWNDAQRIRIKYIFNSSQYLPGAIKMNKAENMSPSSDSILHLSVATVS